MSRFYVINYKIKYEKEIDQGKLLGECTFYPKKEIRVSTSDKNMESTLIHEIIHAFAYEYDIPLSEKKVLRLERAIFRLLKKNNWKLS